jgi:hypothetical protein
MVVLAFLLKKEVTLKKTTEGFSFETDMGGRCRMSKFILIGPDEKKKYRGTFEGWAGTSDLDLSVVPK